jgi:hypothetical protein
MKAMAGKELFSHFGYFQAIYPDVYTAAITGLTIDMRGYEAALFVVNINSYASAGADAATNQWIFTLQHASASTAGADTWSLVPNSQLIHSVAGGYGSTASTGLFFTLDSKTDLGGTTGASGNGILFVGYKGDTNHRYVRLYVSVLSVPSAAWMAGTCILGSPANWPVNETAD